MEGVTAQFSTREGLMKVDAVFFSVKSFLPALSPYLTGKESRFTNVCVLAISTITKRRVM